MKTPTPSVDIEAVFPILRNLRRETIRLHPRRGPDPGLAASKMGGLFLWPSAEPWPRCTIDERSGQWIEDPPQSGHFYLDDSLIAPDDPQHNDYLVGILQVRQADVPQMPFPAGTDLFQLLWCPRYHPDTFAPSCRARWRRVADVDRPRTELPQPRRTDFDDELIPHLCVLSPERVIEYPSLHDLPAALEEQITQWEQTPQAQGYDYYFDLSVASGTKIGGYFKSLNSPHTIPLCSLCRQPMDYLLSVATSEWGSREGQERWCPEEERYLLADVPALHEARLAAAEPCVFISRGYNLNIFVCRRHPEWLVDCSY